MSSNEKARDGLFREPKQLKIVSVEAQIKTQPLGHVSAFDHLAEVANKTAALHRDLAEHQRHASELRAKIKLEDVSS